MIVAFLCVVVALILIKTLRKDFAKYTKNDEDLELVSVSENERRGGGSSSSSSSSDSSITGGMVVIRDSTKISSTQQ